MSDKTGNDDDSKDKPSVNSAFPCILLIEQWLRYYNSDEPNAVQETSPKISYIINALHALAEIYRNNVPVPPLRDDSEVPLHIQLHNACKYLEEQLFRNGQLFTLLQEFRTCRPKAVAYWQAFRHYNYFIFRNFIRPDPVADTEKLPLFFLRRIEGVIVALTVEDRTQFYVRIVSLLREYVDIAYENYVSYASSQIRERHFACMACIMSYYSSFISATLKLTDLLREFNQCIGERFRMNWYLFTQRIFYQFFYKKPEVQQRISDFCKVSSVQPERPGIINLLDSFSLFVESMNRLDDHWRIQRRRIEAINERNSLIDNRWMDKDWDLFEEVCCITKSNFWFDRSTLNGGIREMEDLDSHLFELLNTSWYTTERLTSLAGTCICEDCMLKEFCEVMMPPESRFRNNSHNIDLQQGDTVLYEFPEPVQEVLTDEPEIPLIRLTMCCICKETVLLNAYCNHIVSKHPPTDEELRAEEDEKAFREEAARLAKVDSDDEGSDDYLDAPRKFPVITRKVPDHVKDILDGNELEGSNNENCDFASIEKLESRLVKFGVDHSSHVASTSELNEDRMLDVGAVKSLPGKKKIAQFVKRDLKHFPKNKHLKKQPLPPPHKHVMPKDCSICLRKSVTNLHCALCCDGKLPSANTNDKLTPPPPTKFKSQSSSSSDSEDDDKYRQNSKGATSKKRNTLVKRSKEPMKILMELDLQSFKSVEANLIGRRHQNRDSSADQVIKPLPLTDYEILYPDIEKEPAPPAPFAEEAFPDGVVTLPFNIDEELTSWQTQRNVYRPREVRVCAPSVRLSSRAPAPGFVFPEHLIQQFFSARAVEDPSELYKKTQDEAEEEAFVKKPRFPNCDLLDHADGLDTSSRVYQAFLNDAEKTKARAENPEEDSAEEDETVDPIPDDTTFHDVDDDDITIIEDMEKDEDSGEELPDYIPGEDLPAMNPGECEQFLEILRDAAELAFLAGPADKKITTVKKGKNGEQIHQRSEVSGSEQAAQPESEMSGALRPRVPPGFPADPMDQQQQELLEQQQRQQQEQQHQLHVQHQQYQQLQQRQMQLQKEQQRVAAQLAPAHHFLVPAPVSAPTSARAYVVDTVVKTENPGAARDCATSGQAAPSTATAAVHTCISRSGEALNTRGSPSGTRSAPTVSASSSTTGTVPKLSRIHSKRTLLRAARSREPTDQEIFIASGGVTKNQSQLPEGLQSCVEACHENEENAEDNDEERDVDIVEDEDEDAYDDSAKRRRGNHSLPEPETCSRCKAPLDSNTHTLCLEAQAEKEANKTNKRMRQKAQRELARQEREEQEKEMKEKQRLMEEERRMKRERTRQQRELDNQKLEEQKRLDRERELAKRAALKVEKELEAMKRQEQSRRDKAKEAAKRAAIHCNFLYGTEVKTGCNNVNEKNKGKKSDTLSVETEELAVTSSTASKKRSRRKKKTVLAETTTPLAAANTQVTTSVTSVCAQRQSTSQYSSSVQNKNNLNCERSNITPSNPSQRKTVELPSTIRIVCGDSPSTITVSLKGAKPGEDKVLYTIVNGRAELPDPPLELTQAAKNLMPSVDMSILDDPNLTKKQRKKKTQQLNKQAAKMSAANSMQTNEDFGSSGGQHTPNMNYVEERPVKLPANVTIPSGITVTTVSEPVVSSAVSRPRNLQEQIASGAISKLYTNINNAKQYPSFYLSQPKTGSPMVLDTQNLIDHSATKKKRNKKHANTRPDVPATEPRKHRRPPVQTPVQPSPQPDSNSQDGKSKRVDNNSSFKSQVVELHMPMQTSINESKTHLSSSQLVLKSEQATISRGKDGMLKIRNFCAPLVEGGEPLMTIPDFLRSQRRPPPLIEDFSNYSLFSNPLPIAPIIPSNSDVNTTSQYSGYNTPHNTTQVASQVVPQVVQQVAPQVAHVYDENDVRYKHEWEPWMQILTKLASDVTVLHTSQKVNNSHSIPNKVGIEKHPATTIDRNYDGVSNFSVKDDHKGANRTEYMGPGSDNMSQLPPALNNQPEVTLLSSNGNEMPFDDVRPQYVCPNVLARSLAQLTIGSQPPGQFGNNPSQLPAPIGRPTRMAANTQHHAMQQGPARANVNSGPHEMDQINSGNDQEYDDHMRDRWHENVFAPNESLDGELDPEDRDVEAFKRFCQQSIPPERKEKVVHLNVDDIVIKKKKKK